MRSRLYLAVLTPADVIMVEATTERVMGPSVGAWVGRVYSPAREPLMLWEVEHDLGDGGAVSNLATALAARLGQRMVRVATDAADVTLDGGSR